MEGTERPAFNRVRQNSEIAIMRAIAAGGLTEMKRNSISWRLGIFLKTARSNLDINNIYGEKEKNSKSLTREKSSALDRLTN